MSLAYNIECISTGCPIWSKIEVGLIVILTVTLSASVLLGQRGDFFRIGWAVGKMESKS